MIIFFFFHLHLSIVAWVVSATSSPSPSPSLLLLPPPSTDRGIPRCLSCVSLSPNLHLHLHLHFSRTKDCKFCFLYNIHATNLLSDLVWNLAPSIVIRGSSLWPFVMAAFWPFVRGIRSRRGGTEQPPSSLLAFWILMVVAAVLRHPPFSLPLFSLFHLHLFVYSHLPYSIYHHQLSILLGRRQRQQLSDLGFHF